MDLRGPTFFEGVAAGALVDGDITTNFTDTIMLQVDFSSAPLQGWLTRTQCFRDVNGDDQHSGVGDLGSCVEELKGSRDDDVLILETVKAIETKSSGGPWKHYRYTVKFKDDCRALVGKVELLESSTIAVTQFLRLRIRDRPSINILRWEGAKVVAPSNAAGYEFQSWGLFVMEWNPSPGEVTAVISEVDCLKKVNGSFELTNDLPGFISTWAKEFGGASSNATGTYDEDTGELAVQQRDLKMWGLKGTDWQAASFKFLMAKDMTGMVSKTDSASIRLHAKNHLVVNVAASEGNIVCTSLFGDTIATLAVREETVAEFRSRLAASLPHRGLSIDRLKLVLPDGSIVEDGQNDSPISGLLA